MSGQVVSTNIQGKPTVITWQELPTHYRLVEEAGAMCCVRLRDNHLEPLGPELNADQIAYLLKHHKGVFLTASWMGVQKTSKPPISQMQLWGDSKGGLLSSRQEKLDLGPLEIEPHRVQMSQQWLTPQFQDGQEIAARIRVEVTDYQRIHGQTIVQAQPPTEQMMQRPDLLPYLPLMPKLQVKPKCSLVPLLPKNVGQMHQRTQALLAREGETLT